MMRVNIVCSDSGWIYDHFIKEFKKHSKHTIIKNSKDRCDVTHYLPYYEVPADPNKPCTAWFSHQESRSDLHKKFIDAAKVVDVAISQSARYAKMLRDNHDLHNVIQVMAGTDLDKFKLRESVNIKSKKLIVGHIGRQYTSSNRKNPSLINKISQLPFVDFRATEGKLKPNQIPKFYRDLHVVISPATIEGGPMCVQEALAVGVPIVCLDNVGVANEFKLGVLIANNNDHFVEILEEMYRTKSHIAEWADPNVMERMRAQVEKFTWKWFADQHDKIWQMVTTKSWRNSNEKG
jgi:glycosyltransferase involved in cell wall biosynthesis